MKIRLVIADDHAIVRSGLRRILATAADIEVVEEAIDGNDLLTKLRKTDADVLLLDLSMPGRSGIELIRQVKEEKPRLAVLVLSMHAEEQYAVRALRAGASGYLNKDSAVDLLIGAIRKAAAGGMYVSDAVAQQMAMNLKTGAQVELPHQKLSDREFEIFRALVGGESVSQIANRLHLSVKTVSTHKSHIQEKMAMPSVAALTQYAIAQRLIDQPA